MAAVDLPEPRLGPAAAAAQPVDAGRWRLWVFDAGLACCAVECAAALRRLEASPQDAPVPGSEVNVLLVAGTVTDKLAPLVLRAYQELPGPRRVISFGACSNSGGPYWDSYCVTKGVDQFVPVDVYVPGCPPRPEALLHGLRSLPGVAQPGGQVQHGGESQPGSGVRHGGQAHPGSQG